MKIFDGGNFAPVLLGSVVINLDLVELKAAQLGHGRDDETALLFTHGMLHVLGYDHESDDGQMRAKECEIIEKFRLPKSLIIRLAIRSAYSSLPSVRMIRLLEGGISR